MSEDLIKRSDAIETAYQLRHKPNDAEWEDWLKSFNAIPSADRPKEVIAQITFDEEKLREIVKEAVERFKEEYEIVDRPQGEWKHDGSVWTYRFNCTNCGYHLLGKQTNYCPSCGARMKGADDDQDI